MSREEKVQDNSNYYTINNGTFRVQVPETHPEAVRRDWETKDGKKGTKWERHIKALFGKVVAVRTYTGDFGKNINIYLDENEEGKTPIINVSVNSRYGEDLLKKLPNIKDGVEYRFMPFDFPDKENSEKHIKGVSITTKDDEEKFTVKVGNFFYDAEKEVNINGYPDPTDEDKEDWKFYFTKANKFLVKYLEENVLPRYSDKDVQNEKAVEYPKNEIDPEDITFDGPAEEELK